MGSTRLATRRSGWRYATGSVASAGNIPGLPVLVTSRFAGYGDAPMPESLFVRLELKAFDDEDLRTFVANWYAVQEPNDPQARARGIEDLLAAFVAEPGYGPSPAIPCWPP